MQAERDDLGGAKGEVYGPVLGNLQKDQVWETGHYRQAFIYYWDT